MTEEDLAWAAEPVETVLRRAYPGEASAEELVDETGLSPGEIRGGLEELRRRGSLNENGDYFALNQDGDDPERMPEPRAEEEEEEGEKDVEVDREKRNAAAKSAAALPAASGGGPAYRATYTLMASFSGSRGENRDETAKKDAAALEEAIADVLAAGLGLGVSVELTELEGFSPRRIPLAEEESDEVADE